MKKSSLRKRRLRKEKVLSKADEKVVRKKLGI